jgi:hypothetical protein
MKYVLAIFLFLTNSAHAWNYQNFGSEISSPVTTKASYILLIGSAATLTFALFEDQVGDPLQKDAVEDKPLGKFSVFGDLAGQLLPNAGYALAQYAWGENNRSLGMIKASGYASLITTSLKYTVREPRPNDHSIKNSFPSGHSTTAFAFSGYIWQEHGWKWGIPALVVSSFSAFSRINDNRHYLHDVIGGATIGFSYGLGISMLEKNKIINEDSISFFPIFDLDVKGAVLVKTF